MYIIRLFFVFLTCYMVVFPVDAAINTAGEVNYLSGNASLIRHDTIIDLHNHDGVYASDVIVTSHTGRVQLAMHDGSHVYIGRDSRIRINRYQVKKGRLLSGMFNMLWGKARYVVEKMRAEHAEFIVVTKAATIGVRGTQFTVVVPKPSLNTNKIHLLIKKLPVLPTKVMLFEGVVVARTISNKTLTMKPGQFVKFMPSGYTITRPIREQDTESLKGIIPVAPSSDAGKSHAGDADTGNAVLTTSTVVPIVIPPVVVIPPVHIKPVVVSPVLITPVVIHIKPAVIPPVLITPVVVHIKPVVVSPVLIKPVAVRLPILGMSYTAKSRI